MDDEDCKSFVSIVLEQHARATSFSLYLPEPEMAQQVAAELEARGLRAVIDLESGNVTVDRF